MLAVACAKSEENLVQDAVLKGLIDPDSAKFGEITIIGDKACATVNSKNNFGGYAGNKQAILKKIDGAWDFMGTLPSSNAICVALHIHEKSEEQIAKEMFK